MHGTPLRGRPTPLAMTIGEREGCAVGRRPLAMTGGEREEFAVGALRPRNDSRGGVLPRNDKR